jgi:hypothetical protein
MTESNTALSPRADDDPVLAAIELTADAWRRYIAGRAREPKDADGTAAVLTPAYARWQTAQDDICQDWDGAYTLMLATPPTTAAGAAALIGVFAIRTRSRDRARKRCSAAANLARLPGGLRSGRSAHEKRNTRSFRQQRRHSGASAMRREIASPRDGWWSVPFRKQLMLIGMY